MTIRIAFIGAAALILSGSSAQAQKRPPQQVVLSKAVVNSMTASKSKSKAPLTARLGMVRKSSVVVTKSGQTAPTSVRQISPTAKKK